MHPFAYVRPDSWESATGALSAVGAVALGGGTDLIPLTRESLAAPQQVVDLRGIEEATSLHWTEDGSLSIGAAVTLRDIVRNARVRADFPALVLSCHAVGSYALRNMGTLGGNLCQHVRCWYYRHGHECLRSGGGICSALDGENQYHAIFPQGPCVAVHPSDPAVALSALEAVVHVRDRHAARSVPCAEFFAASRNRLDAETVLAAGEVVTAVTIPASSSGGMHFYEKIMQRGAWDFALVSLAAIRRRDGDVRMFLGGVANTPWRVTDSVEEDVASAGLSDDDIETLAQRALYDAQPLAMNGYKLEIAAALIRRAITRLNATR
ncbi:MAG: FAD binding domain-containing protein [Gemmatimonadaceae bacterium]